MYSWHRSAFVRSWIDPPWSRVALLLIGQLVVVNVGHARSLRIDPGDLPALQYAIFIKGDGHPKNLVDSTGHKIDFGRLYARQSWRSDDQLTKDLAGQQKLLAGPDSAAAIGPNYDYHAYLHGLLDGFEHSGKHRLLLWVHGARNPIGGSPTRTLELVRALRNTDYYPICINWQSSDLSSYWSHLTYARPSSRKGFEDFCAGFKAPLLLLHDLGQGVARVPLEVSGDLARTWTSFRCGRNALHQNVGGLAYSRGSAKTGLRRFLKSGWALVSLPLRTAFMVPISGAGPGEWEGFLHSTDEMFHTDHDLRKTNDPLPERPGTGALAEFMDSLDVHLTARAARGDSVEITLVAHSMGTIVACEMLRRNQDLPVRQIVFMAAACRVHNLFDTIVPFLEKPEHQTAHFSNLMLHQSNEVDETFLPIVGDLVYRGSLLTWIDDFLGTTESPMERTLGRDENATPATAFIPAELRSRVVFKTFGNHDPDEIRQYGARRIPSRHSDFSDPQSRFWQPDFWQADGAAISQAGQD